MNYEPFKLYLLNNENNISKIISYSTQEGDDYDEQLQQEGVTIESQKINIYKDDVIENAKFKLVSQLSDNNIENYYFFVKRKFRINVRELLNNNKRSDGYISRNTLITILRNLNLPDFDSEFHSQNEHLIEDVNEKLGEFVSISVNIPIGLDYNINRPEYVVNPLENTFNYSYLSVDEKNSDLLFECGNFEENIIYCIHIEEYFKYIQDNAMLSLEDTMNIYFKSLHSKKIFSASGLQKYEEKLVDKYQLYNELVDAHVIFHENNITKWLIIFA